MSDDVRDPRVAGLVPAQPDAPDAQLRTFLIADVRGYTSFTQRNGDEAAGKLASKFAAVAREVVAAHQGTVLELRGDEALCVFVSPRQAIRAAAALQGRFVDETRRDPQLPLPVGIGIDVGEAVAVEGGYRGGALNLAARLCSMAKPGEILATAEVTHLARRLDGLTYAARVPIQLKGISDPVRPVRVTPEGNDPSQQLAALDALPPKPPTAVSGPTWLPARLRRRPRLALVAVVVVAAVVVPVLVVGSGDGSRPLVALRENVAGIVDVASGRLVGDVPVGAAPGAVAVGFGAVWVANTQDGTISRLDPQSRRVVQVIDVGSAPTGVAVGNGAVWVANSGSGSVSRIDPATNHVTLTVAPAGSGPSALAFGGGALWVVDTTGGSLLRIDPSTGSVEVAARVGASPAGLAVSAGQVWVSSSGTGTVEEYDIRARAVVQTVHVGNDPRGVAVAAGSVWVANNLDGTVSRIEPRTASVVATLSVGAAPVAVAGDADGVWVAAEGAALLTRIDPRANRVVARVPTASRPGAIALDGGTLWSTAGVNPALHRGGTETAIVVEQAHLDPAVGYDYPSESVDMMLYDGLLGLRRTAGAAGGTVVPDLAVGLPTVADNGRTYTFRLRQGIRWPDGSPVTGADVRRGLERVVAAGIWPLYGDIVGAAACTKTRCDLSAGVVVDNASSLVTIRLRKPDPEFVFKLALPGADAVPASTPIGALHGTVLPSTGPYRVDAATARQITLVRNPRFREWSAAAQPAGFPDRIVVDLRTDNPTPLTNRVLDSVDWSSVNNTPDLPALRARFGDRVRLAPAAGTQFLFLNTAVPPFDDVRVRRAVNFAIDRDAVVNHWPFPGTATCQLLPPTIPAYEPYCPYTLRPDATGRWHAPDIATAQGLVRRAGARGARVTIDTPPGLGPGMAVIMQAMRSIGLVPRLHLVTNPNYFAEVAPDAYSGRAQAGFAGWGADYPAASNFVQTELTCASLGLNGSNLARFCDRALDRRVAAAERQQAEDPAAATAAWTAIDRELADLSPLVPLLNSQRVSVVSARLRNAQSNPIFGALYDQAWVR